MNTFEKLVKKNHFDYNYINTNFKYVPSKTNGKVVLEYPNKVLFTQELFDKYEFASLEQLLQFALDNPDEQKKYPIGVIWKNSNQFWCAYLYGDGTRRRLSVYRAHPGAPWYGNSRFLVRKSLKTEKLDSSESLVSWPLDELVINGIKYKRINN